EGQREKARAKSKFKGATREQQPFTGFARVPPTMFDGYDKVSVRTRVVGLAKLEGEDESPVEASRLDAGDAGWIVLEETPFYLQSGGQISDKGEIRNDFGFRAIVSDVTTAGSGIRVHTVRVESGDVTVGAPVIAEIDSPRRSAIRRNHTA